MSTEDLVQKNTGTHAMSISRALVLRLEALQFQLLLDTQVCTSCLTWCYTCCNNSNIF